MTNNITVSSNGINGKVNVTADTAQYWSEKSREWAISEELVDREDYSSKYYAKKSKEAADVATGAIDDIEASKAEFDSSYNEKSQALNTQYTEAITNITTEKNTALKQISLQSGQEVEEIKAAGEIQIDKINAYDTTAKDWAIKMDGKVQDEDYSSKYYAAQAKQSENIVNEAVQDFEGVTQEVVDNAIQQINTESNNQVNRVTSTGDTQNTRIITEGNTQVSRLQAEGQQQINNIQATGIFVEGDTLYYTTEDGEVKEFEGGGGGGVMNYGMSLYSTVDPQNPGLLISQGQRNSGDIYKGFWDNYVIKKVEPIYTCNGTSSIFIPDTVRNTEKMPSGFSFNPHVVNGVENVISLSVPLNLDINKDFCMYLYIRPADYNNIGTATTEGAGKINLYTICSSTDTPIFNLYLDVYNKSTTGIYLGIETFDLDGNQIDDETTSTVLDTTWEDDYYEVYLSFKYEPSDFIKPNKPTHTWKAEYQIRQITEGRSGVPAYFSKCWNVEAFYDPDDAYNLRLQSILEDVFSNGKIYLNKNNSSLTSLPSITEAKIYYEWWNTDYINTPHFYGGLFQWDRDSISPGKQLENWLTEYSELYMSEADDSDKLIVKGLLYEGLRTDIDNVKDINDPTATEYDFKFDLETKEFILPTKNGNENIIDYSITTTYTNTFVAPQNGYCLSYQTVATNETAVLREDEKAIDAGQNLSTTTKGIHIRGFVNHGKTISKTGVTEWGDVAFHPLKGNGDLYYYVGDSVKNQGEIDIAEITTALANKPDKEDIDGQWVGKSYALWNNMAIAVTSASGIEYTFDLSDYLPADDFNYEILIKAEFNDSSFIICYIYSSIITSQSTTITKGPHPTGGCTIFPIGTDRKLYFKIINAGTTTAHAWATIAGYRRLGKNQ